MRQNRCVWVELAVRFADTRYCLRGLRMELECPPPATQFVAQSPRAKHEVLERTVDRETHCRIAHRLVQLTVASQRWVRARTSSSGRG